MCIDKETVRDLALRCGFSECGFTGVDPFEQYEEELRVRASADLDSADRYLNMLPRARPAERHKWARSIIVCIRRYGKYRFPAELEGYIGRNYLCDSRHKECPDRFIDDRFKEGLKALGVRFKKGGVPDRAAAVRAGVVRIGRNNFAYSKDGSWINIETWVVDAELAPDQPSTGSPCPDGCARCLKECPTGALYAPNKLRISCCIAYLTYSAPEPVESALWSRMGCWIYGCDVCQQVCPLNEGRWECTEPTPWLDSVKEHLLPDALLKMDQQIYTDIVHPLFWYISLSNIGRWHRNARRALINMQDGKQKGQSGRTALWISSSQRITREE